MLILILEGSFPIFRTFNGVFGGSLKPSKKAAGTKRRSQVTGPGHRSQVKDYRSQVTESAIKKVRHCAGLCHSFLGSFNTLTESWRMLGNFPSVNSGIQHIIA